MAAKAKTVELPTRTFGFGSVEMFVKPGTDRYDLLNDASLLVNTVRRMSHELSMEADDVDGDRRVSSSALWGIGYLLQIAEGILEESLRGPEVHS